MEFGCTMLRIQSLNQPLETVPRLHRPLRHEPLLDSVTVAPPTHCASSSYPLDVLVALCTYKFR